jgi:hypothetical protein
MIAKKRSLFPTAHPENVWAQFQSIPHIYCRSQHRSDRKPEEFIVTIRR